MPASATMIGALLGLGTQMYSNALRKLPYMRHPWEHVLGMGLGAVFANQLVKWDAKLQEDLDKMLDKAKAANERRYFEVRFAYIPPSQDPTDSYAICGIYRVWLLFIVIN
ncbi:putative NADH:ubiquinone reductase (H(+)-translocating) [Helianthus debilis subsp. tardiflorus]